MDIAVDPLPSEIASPPVLPSQLPPESGAIARATAATQSRQGPPPTGDVVPLTAAPGDAHGAWTFSPTRPALGPDRTGVGLSDSALARATAAGVAGVLAEAKKKTEDRAGKPPMFSARDMELGLVPGNNYVSLVGERVRSSLLPSFAHALLEFWTDSAGLVTRVRVVNPSSDASAWADVALALASDARRTPSLKIPSNAAGLIVTIDVTLELKTVTGSTPSQSALTNALRAIQDPIDTLLDAKASSHRAVTAKVVGVEAF